MPFSFEEYKIFPPFNSNKELDRYRPSPVDKPSDFCVKTLFLLKIHFNNSFDKNAPSLFTLKINLLSLI